MDRSLLEVLAARRTSRQFADVALASSDLAFILLCSFGVTGFEQGNDGTCLPLRAVPSAGALYSAQVYPYLGQVNGLASTLCHFDPVNADLSILPRRALRHRVGLL